MGLPIPLSGCRHDVLGHALKAIGLLRALAECAAPQQCDRDAEGWWDLEAGRFELGLSDHRDESWLVEFFMHHYTPTPIIAAWNKGGGVDGQGRLPKRYDVVVSGDDARLKSFPDQWESLSGRPKAKRSKAKELKLKLPSENRSPLEVFVGQCGLDIQFDSPGKKAGTIPDVARLLSQSPDFRRSLELAETFANRLQADSLNDQQERALLAALRDQYNENLVEALMRYR